MQAHILIKCKKGSDAKIISEFKELPEITEINGVWGKQDIILKVLTHDSQFVSGLATRLQNHPDVTDTYTMHVLYGKGGTLDEE